MILTLFFSLLYMILYWQNHLYRQQITNPPHTYFKYLLILYPRFSFFVIVDNLHKTSIMSITSIRYIFSSQIKTIYKFRADMYDKNEEVGRKGVGKLTDFPTSPKLCQNIFIISNTTFDAKLQGGHKKIEIIQIKK